jgi:two-component system, NtrC family, sensor histidine kinase HydH
MTTSAAEMAVMAIVRRAEERYTVERTKLMAATDRMFGGLMLGQWAFAVAIALLVSPWAWEGKERTVHMHVWTAIVLGGIISSLPLILIKMRPGSALTRHVVAGAQMLFSALLIHLSGGRIETHFHVFGSLGILAAYRDWTVLVTATVVVASDHLIRGLVWPESVYGIVNPEWWRFLEHAFWVVFAISFLVVICVRGLRDLRAIAERTAELEALSESEWRKSSVLDRAEETPAVAGVQAATGGVR